MPRKFLLCLICAALVLGLAGCGSKPAADAAEVPTETTEATVPVTTPADGNPDDVTCLGTYSATDEEVAAAADTVIASISETTLTNRQLQLYYWLEVAAHRISNDPVQPNYSQGLDTQICTLDSSVNSWQQYFLNKALSSWHARQALIRMGNEEGTPTEEEYKPDLEKRKEYMTGMPATEYLYQWSESYKPNRLHQTYLDTLPETLETLAADNGFTNNDAQAKAIAGNVVTGEDLTEYATDANRAYMYFTEMGYHFEPTEEDILTYCTDTLSGNGDVTGKTATIRHILLIPDEADIAPDGTVTAGDDAWDRCRVQAQTVMDKWKSKVNKTRYAQFTSASVAESRFAEVAKDYSQDAGTAANGGLYVQLQPGQLLPELDAWCFDDAREHGDCEIIRSPAGMHIVFFSDFNENRYTDAENQLLHHEYEELIRSAMEKYPTEFDFSAIRLGQAEDNGSFVTTSDLLYPDIAHERFPDMPLYLQQDYPDAPFGNYKVSTHGCGITTLAMVASYMADDELTPAELAARYGYYCGERGSEIVMFDDTPAEMGFHLQNRSYSWGEMDEALKNGQVVVSVQYYGYWTRGGHYIAMIGMTNDDRYVVRDSNLLNYKRIQYHAQDSHSRGSISEAGQYYWIYEPKIVSIGACARCGDADRNTPEILLQSDYLCEKCLTATLRRNSFLSSITG